MAPRKRDAAPIDAAPPGGTSVGWTFWSTAAECSRRWLLRYVMGLNPAKPQPYLILGTCYHALLEGKTAAQIARWGPDFVLALPEAMSLYKARLEKGPPLPKATAIERELSLLNGQMTSKPDREEGTREHRVVRDFKTSGVRSQTDDAYWAINGEIIGEMVAAGAKSCIVDIINKRDGKTSQLEVELTPAKEQALRELVEDLEHNLCERLDRAHSESAISPLFPKKMTSCFGKYGQCHYYDRCWSGGAARLLYVKSPNNVRWIRALQESLDTPPMVVEAIATKAIAEGI